MILKLGQAAQGKQQIGWLLRSREGTYWSVAACLSHVLEECSWSDRCALLRRELVVFFLRLGRGAPAGCFALRELFQLSVPLILRWIVLDHAS